MKRAGRGVVCYLLSLLCLVLAINAAARGLPLFLAGGDRQYQTTPLCKAACQEQSIQQAHEGNLWMVAGVTLLCAAGGLMVAGVRLRFAKRAGGAAGPGDSI